MHAGMRELGDLMQGAAMAPFVLPRDNDYHFLGEVVRRDEGLVELTHLVRIPFPVAAHRPQEDWIRCIKIACRALAGKMAECLGGGAVLVMSVQELPGGLAVSEQITMPQRGLSFTVQIPSGSDEGYLAALFGVI